MTQLHTDTTLPARQHTSSTRRQRGFTIVELLIVIVVIAILATISIVAYNGIQARARQAVVQQDLKNIMTAVELFRHQEGRLPVVPLSTVTASDLEQVLRDAGLFEQTQGNGNTVEKSFVFCQSPARDRLVVVALRPLLNGLSSVELERWDGSTIFYYDTQEGRQGTAQLEYYEGANNTGVTLCRSVTGEAWQTRWSFDVPTLRVDS